MAESLTIAVVSDLHAYDYPIDKEPPPSTLCTLDSETPHNRHPIAALSHLIHTEPALRSNILMCCGDMGDKARPAGINYTWQKLQALKSELGASELFVTPGNHDVDSRHKHNDFDAKGYLQGLTPRFPFEDEHIWDRFWSRNYVVMTMPHYRVVVLNTSAYHGGQPEEYEHGRISTRTVDQLKNELVELETREPRTINILLCHHHPHNYGDLEENDQSLMSGGNRLLQTLDQLDSDWIVIHGHKHHPRIAYAAGDSSALVFSAGSLCAPNGPSTGIRNQFYLLTFPLESDTLIGKFQAWDWIPNIGWQLAQRTSGLPSSGGFGNRQKPNAIAKEINEIFLARSQPYLSWSEITGALPLVEYVLPDSLEKVIKRLRETHGIQTSRNTDGTSPLQIGKSM
ncbi:MAG: metallophosphoesterase [Chloracidobacterium sp.]|nr:metallophosphoesterase [Chloracidobacterium sp.]